MAWVDTRGEEASRIATQVIQAYFVEHWDSVKPNSALLEGAFSRQIKRLCRTAAAPERSEMGTTAVAVIFGSTSLGLLVGDSHRAALFQA